MKQSPSWEANQFSASQEIPCILWNPKIHYSIHKSPSWASLQTRQPPIQSEKYQCRIDTVSSSDDGRIVVRNR